VGKIALHKLIDLAMAHYCSECGVTIHENLDEKGFPLWRKSLNSVLGMHEITPDTIFFCSPICSLKNYNNKLRSNHETE
jgi:hypothetical protein